MNQKIEKVKSQVAKLLDSDNSGHGMEHTNRVMTLALKFAEDKDQEITIKPAANLEVVALIALLHDVDDYKLFGEQNAESLSNARNILNSCGIEQDVQNQVLAAIKTIGYSKRLKGITPDTIEGKIVSDADMCDGMGATGIVRAHQYNLAHGRRFFDRTNFPTPVTSSEEYKAKTTGTVVTHLFEKVLKLRDLMLTAPGREEAAKRHDFTVQFLRQFFAEENAPEWAEYLDDYLDGKIAK